MTNTALTAAGATARDLEILEELNRGYIRSAEFSDVRWYEEHLAEDYLSTNPDGSLVDRAGFLARMTRPYPGSNLEALDVRIRLLGDVALIHAGFRDTRPDGRVGEGRYTDIWARREGRWLCVAAHFTRW
jgi:ketosteroid isomerase-like protein